MTYSQKTFALTKEQYTQDSFFVCASNEKAFAWATADNAQSVLIVGPRASGKTHLAHIWAQKHEAAFFSGANPLALLDRYVVCDAAEHVSAKTLYSLFNTIKEKEGALLLTMCTVPEYTLPDWVSRLNTLSRVFLHSPSQNHVFAILQKRMQEHRILCSEEILRYVVQHIPYDYAAVDLFMTKLFESMQEYKGITLSVVRSILKAMQI